MPVSVYLQQRLTLAFRISHELTLISWLTPIAQHLEVSDKYVEGFAMELVQSATALPAALQGVRRLVFPCHVSNPNLPVAVDVASLLQQWTSTACATRGTPDLELNSGDVKAKASAGAGRAWIQRVKDCTLAKAQKACDDVDAIASKRKGQAKCEQTMD